MSAYLLHVQPTLSHYEGAGISQTHDRIGRPVACMLLASGYEIRSWRPFERSHHQHSGSKYIHMTAQCRLQEAPL